MSPPASPKRPAPHKGNILLVANWTSGVGYAWWLMENFWGAIAERYAETGTEIHLAYPAIDGVPPSVDAAAIEIHERPFGGQGLAGAFRLARWIHRRRIRNVYLTDRPFLHPLYLLLRLAGVRRVIVHDHTPGDRPPTHGPKRWIKRFIHSIPWIRADFYVGVTEFIRDRLVDNANLPPARCGFATNGIIPIEEDEPKVDVRAEFGFPRDSIVVVTTGRAHRYKGIDFLIDLVNELVVVQGRTDVYLLYCGDGPHLESFQERAGTLGLGAHFTFAGRRQDVRALLPSCDVGVQASGGEVGYSLSILEYMSAGLATLVPDLPSTSLATEPGETGLLYRAGSLESAVREMDQLLEDPDLRRRLGENARAAVAERFLLTETNRQLLAILDREFA